MLIQQITCKTALSKSKLPGLDYSLNPYRGCEHKCVYCYVPNVLKIKRDKWGEFIDVKVNIPNILTKELKNKKYGVVGISTVTDPYQPIEKKVNLTSSCLKELLKHDFPISIQTKSSLIERDIDILSQFSNVEIMMSISTIDDTTRRVLEPYASPIQKRLEVLKKFSNVGIQTSIFFGPIWPSISIEDIPQIIDTFIAYDTKKIWIDSLHLKQGIGYNIKKAIGKNQELYTTFLKYGFNNQKHYTKIRSEIFRIGKNRKIPIIDAF